MYTKVFTPNCKKVHKIWCTKIKFGAPKIWCTKHHSNYTEPFWSTPKSKAFFLFVEINTPTPQHRVFGVHQIFGAPKCGTARCTKFEMHQNAAPLGAPNLKCTKMRHRSVHQLGVKKYFFGVGVLVYFYTNTASLVKCSHFST